MTEIGGAINSILCCQYAPDIAMGSWTAVLGRFDRAMAISSTIQMPT